MFAQHKHFPMEWLSLLNINLEDLGGSLKDY